MIKVLIVDDHHLFAEGVKSMFNAADGIEVVAHTMNGNAIASILETTDIDLILMDIDMPVIDGIASMELLKSKGFDKPILMLTMHQSIKMIRDALEKGAQGYILKDASKSDLVQAIKTTSQRQNYFHPKINDQVFNYLRGKNTVNTDQLSSREKEIIKCVSQGMNTKAISGVLFISEHTVKTHRRNIMHKLNVKTSAELIKLALDKGII
ncbi:response regulator transcription factor [Flavobacterium sp. MFBS3-15]|uniref:response regulator n=1 Tax=Flavobacterium sp. MFBS3-15 TaxID=2989816 RepID=UPI002235C47F|nr:response regulator transcription factor [Flavobacterium sp. MFBS3-15]MCW4467952.1 response regulator transcription factor [Flavobacterium sp. MFBS3-15]